MKTTILDYGVGNLLSVHRALTHLGADVLLTDRWQDIENAEKLILPGVGAFADCMHELKTRKMVDPLKNYLKGEKTFLGICVGMQMLFEVGEEFGMHEGLNFIKGSAARIPSLAVDGSPLRVPHIGWNRLIVNQKSAYREGLLKGLDETASAYFVHSYAGKAQDPKDVLAYTDFGGHQILAAVQVGPIYGTQFHPERSGPVGLQVLKNFLEI